MSSAFQVDREIFSNSIWTNVAEFRMFFYILGNAVWKESGIMMGNVLVGRGQYLRSYRNLREDLVYLENNAIKHYSLSHIKTTTDKLVKDGRLEKTETELGTLFTVCNYELYQGFERFKKQNTEQSENAERTEKERRENNKKKDNKDNKELYKDIVEYLNLKTGKRFAYTTKPTTAKINARLEEGFTLDDFKKVIDIKVSEWLSDANMQKYLRPETLFGNKFESYLYQETEAKQDIEAKDNITRNWRGSDRRL